MKKLYVRLISQDRLREVPYGRCVVFAKTEKTPTGSEYTHIYAAVGTSRVLMGTYPTAEEALKVLDDLRNPDECHDGYFYFPPDKEHTAEKQQVIEVRSGLADAEALRDILKNSGYEASCRLVSDDSHSYFRVTYQD